MPYGRRTCIACQTEYIPPQGGKRENQAADYRERALKYCAACRRISERGLETDYAPFREKGAPPPERETVAVSRGSDLLAPLVQGVFDLETWGLDRGWGVTLVGCIMVHRGGPEPEWHEFDLTQSTQWPEVRSNDRELVAKILAVLETCHVLYAHNGEYFDIRWLRTVALKYNLVFNPRKLIDPAAIARQKYRIGRNSLEAVGDFLGLPDTDVGGKMHISPDVWRSALLDNSAEAWTLLRERCRSDVRMLNAIAARVANDIRMIDSRGSAYR